MQDDRCRSPGPRCHHASPHSYASRHSHFPASHSQRRRSRDRSSLSVVGMTRRPARNVSLSPRRRSPLHPVQQSSRGRRMSPRTGQMSPNRRSRHSSSRSPTPITRRKQISRSRSPRSRSSDWDRQRHLHEADQRLLRLRDVSPVPQQDEDMDADQNL